MSEPERIPVHTFAPAEVGELDLYQKRERIYTRKVEGFFQRLQILYDTREAKRKINVMRQIEKIHPYQPLETRPHT